jgi:hypothetical protein
MTILKRDINASLNDIISGIKVMSSELAPLVDKAKALVQNLMQELKK